MSNPLSSPPTTRGVTSRRRTIQGGSVDAHMLQWATKLEADAVRAYLEHGTCKKAAASLGVKAKCIEDRLRRVKARAARAGYAPRYGSRNEVQDGYFMKRQSILRRYGKDKEGNELPPEGETLLAWTIVEPEKEDMILAFREAIESMVDEYRGCIEPVAPAPLEGEYLEDTLACHLLADPHIGMLSWGRETGRDYDLKIAENEIYATMDNLFASVPRTRNALLVDLGDWFHADDDTNRTKRGNNPLDSDSRYHKMVEIGLRIKRRWIERALQHHDQVEVWNKQGNHDYHTSTVVGVCLAAMYEHEPRVVIESAPQIFNCMQWGQNMICATHGHTMKPEKLALFGANEYRRIWGNTKRTIWYTGHVHHNTVKEMPGNLVESVRALAAKDAWHHASGYCAEREMKCDLWHLEKGRTGSRYEQVPDMETIYGVAA